MLTFTAFVFIGITVTSAYKGIPDSEDKHFVLEQGEYSCVSQKTLPKNFTFVNTWMGRPIVYVLSENAQFDCPNKFIFELTRHDFYIYEMTISVNEVPELYEVREFCKKDPLPLARFEGWSDYQFKAKEKERIVFKCHWFKKDSDYHNVEYTLFTNNSCNFWLCMGPLEHFKRQPPYPAFSFPVDKANYYLASDPLPKELQATDTGLAIDVLKASGQVFTIYKTPKRPIQTIEVKTPRLCSSMVVSMDFDGMCTIYVDLGPNQVTFYVNGRSVLDITRPLEVVITFTNSTAYLYTFGTLGFYPLTDCKFDASLVEKAEYNLKVWYDTTRASSSCEMIKIRILDAAAIKRWATTTTATVITTTTTLIEEAPTTELPASTASTKTWAVVAVVCFAALIVVIVAALLLIRWLKKY